MTRGDVKTALQALGYATDTDTMQNAAIMATLRRVAGMHRWPWQEFTGTVTVAAGINSFLIATSSLGTAVQHIDAVRIENGTTYVDLEWTPAQEMRRMAHLDRTRGVPQKWTVQAGYVQIYPLPDLTYTLTVDYVKVATVLTADADELPMPDSYDEIMKWGSAAHLAYRERDWNAYNASEAMFEKLVREAWSATGMKSRQSARHVTRSGVHTAASYIGPGSL